MNLSLIAPYIMLLVSINAYRIDHNLKPVSLNNDTCILATQRLGDIEGYFSHVLLVPRVHADNIGGWTHENLAKGFTDYKDVLKGWEESPTHNANLLSDSKYGCIASDGHYWTLEMNKP